MNAEEWKRMKLLKESESYREWRGRGVSDPYISKRVHDNGQPSIVSEETHKQIEEIMNGRDEA